ncbi:hypothetical protein M2138_000181 [Dysgonomonadaceae bacterium PH5-43]|nr:hypothetical protein [Dysgonomonadaceae bacterium PH5-43]
MDGDSQRKVLQAGFMIIRKDDQPNIRIKRLKSNSSWITLEKFDTKAARDRRFKQLMKLSTVIND